MTLLRCMRAVLPTVLVCIVFTHRLEAQSQSPRRGGDDLLTGAKSEVYKTVGDTRLKLYIFAPEGHRPEEPRPAIVFFFGGGWRGGSANQFAPHCKRLAERGMVAIAADYRVYSRQRARVVDCVADAQSAMRWVRANAKRLGIDPNRIAAGGGSAGGHLAAATAMLRDFTEGEDKSVSFKPNALALFNPALDLRSLRARDGANPEQNPGVRARLGAEVKELSPAAYIKPGLPPTLIFHGKADALIPYAQMEGFVKEMKAAGNRCTLIGFEGQGHGFFNAGKAGDRYFNETYKLAQEFLSSLGYLRAVATAPAAARDGGR